MTSKERAYLRGLANQVPALYQVGKDGITDNMVTLINDALAARELIKVHVLENSMMSTREAAEEMAIRTASQVVQVIGNKFIIYKLSEKNICNM